jgi:hypothetical protein
MPSAGKQRKGQSTDISSMLQLDQNPKRRVLILCAVAVVVVAIAAVAVGALRGGSGCNAVLSAQRFGCIEALAGQTGNAILCRQITNQGMETSCIMAVARVKGNVSVCGSLLGGQYRTNCIDNVSYSKSDPSLCNGLDSFNQSLCSYNIAAKLNFSESSYCSGMEEKFYQTLCYSQSYYHLALSTGNYSYCGNLPAIHNNTILYAMALQNPNYQPSTGGLFTSVVNTTPRDLCYASFSSPKSQASCAYISNSTLRSACNAAGIQSNATVSIQNVTAYCANTGTTQLRNLCYFGAYSDEAIVTLNVSWCSQIANQSYMRSCVVNLATSTSNSVYCGALQNSSQVNSCLNEVTLASGNYS